MKPFKFSPNRVWRVYQGGAGIDRLRGVRPESDGFFPEDWVASDTTAMNPEVHGEREGISRAVIDGREVFFDDFLREHAEELLGREHLDRCGVQLGFLTKILDSAVRLPLQAHPDRPTSKRLFHSPFGKTEAWVVLGTRSAESYLAIGFNEKLDKELFAAEAAEGVMTRSLEMVHRHPVKAGDVLMISGGLMHAIGPGVTLIEIMEPSDWVVQPERFCADYRLDDRSRFCGLSCEQALEIFDFVPMSAAEAWNQAALTPEMLIDTPEIRAEILVDRRKSGFFGALRLHVDGMGSFSRPESCLAGIVTEGGLVLTDGGAALELKQGDTFFIPCGAEGLTWQGRGTVILSQPPA